GAVKTNVGHLESAAGAASLAKMVLALQHDKLPPSINYAGPNPYIDFDATHLRFLDSVADWPRYSGYAIAGVSSFGFGGANAHLVLREVLPRDVVEREPEPQPEPEAPAAEKHVEYVGGVRFDEYGEFIESGESGEGAAAAKPEESEPELPGITEEALRLKEVALEERAAQEVTQDMAKPLVPLAVSAFLTSRKKAAAAELADWMESPEGQASSLESIGRSLSRRNHGRSRAVVLAHDHDEAINGLRAVADGKQRPTVFSVDGPVTNGPVWVLAGFGAQHRKMGKNLYLRDEVFAEWIDKCDALIQDERGYSILEMILDDSQDYGIETTQVVIFAIQIALGELLRHHGAKPAAVVGQSLGEAASAYFAGGLSLQDATRAICSRSHLMGEGEAMLFGEYIRLMALVEYSAE
ncbi:MAG: acyltransferase domain-containing protein, partial [Mycobacterium sp.]